MTRWFLRIGAAVALILAAGWAVPAYGEALEPVPATAVGTATATATATAAAAAAGTTAVGRTAAAAGTAGTGHIFREHDTSFFDRAISFFGIFFMLACCWVLSANRRMPAWRTVLWGAGLQLLFGIIILKVPGVSDFFFVVVDGGVRRLLSFAEAGADFVFQSVTPHEVTWAETPDGPYVTEVFIGRISPVMKTFAFWILPTIIFFSAFMTVLYHLGVMQWVVAGFARVMQVTMGTSGSESLSAAANIFLGQTESPLVVKPFVETMTRSELHAIMTGGFATVAGGVLAVYVGVLRDVPGIAGHLVTASIMSAPASLACSKLMFPETEDSHTAGRVKLEIERPDANFIEALARGSTEGMTLMLNVMAMLIAFVAMVAMANFILGTVGVSLEQLLGYVFFPFALAMGIPWDECGVAGQLLGEKLVLTELIAYLDLQKILKSGEAAISQRTALILSYALCGFANFASIGIQLGGIGGIAPTRRRDLAQLGVRAMIAGMFAAYMTACVVGVLL